MVKMARAAVPVLLYCIASVPQHRRRRSASAFGVGRRSGHWQQPRQQQIVDWRESLACLMPVTTVMPDAVAASILNGLDGDDDEERHPKRAQSRSARIFWCYSRPSTVLTRLATI